MNAEDASVATESRERAAGSFFAVIESSLGSWNGEGAETAVC